MWKIYLLGVLFISGCATSNTKEISSQQRLSPSGETSTTAPQIPASNLADADIASIVSGSQALGVDLYRKIQSGPDGNIFISPLSISSAFGLAYAGSNGETARGMAEVLNFELDNTRIHRALGQVQKITEDETEGQLFDMANTIFFDQASVLETPYVALIADNYSAEPQKVNYRTNPDEAIAVINKWVENQTRGLIPKTVTSNDVTKDTRSVMVNTAYLKADWYRQFSANHTQDGQFYTADSETIVRLMNMTDNFKMIDERGFRALELPYQNNTMSAIVFLPDVKTGLPSFEKKLSQKNLSKWIEHLGEEELQRVKLTLPKVDITFNAKEITSQLIGLGMTEAFSDKADFNGRILGEKQPDGLPTKLSKVIHKTVLKIDEEGTEAAAVTAISDIVVTGVRVQNDLEIFRVDHPFFLIIKNNETNAILFMGRIVDPMPEAEGQGSDG